jgi:rfaE bifunctional protein nucleotidyltransferase chain/domain
MERPAASLYACTSNTADATSLPQPNRSDTESVHHMKIVPRDELIAIRRRLGITNQTFVFTNGCFDLLHRGHVEYLQEARALGDCLAVGLNDDSGVRALKGPGRPLIPQADRAALLTALECVSYVCIFPEESVESLVADLMPDVLVKGGDYAPQDIVGREIVIDYGGRVCTLPLWQGLSSSELIHRIRALPDE